MSSLELGPQGLLVYNSTYRVLICRECQYAIQKSALRSHLLRHKIYRRERQDLLSSIAQLDLCEPHEVAFPTPTSQPIESLAVLSGYRCLVEGCGSLCSSTKRMRQHQSKEHGLSESHNLNSLTFPTQLQTFFRGTKLKYFEVAGWPIVGTVVAPLPISTHGHHGIEDFLAQGNDEQTHASILGTPSPPQQILEASSMSLRPSTVDIDLDILMYFHHFTKTTSVTLPCISTTRPASDYWQTEVVSYALQQRWMMCGLLAISSSHLAALSNNNTTERVHREKSVSFTSDFLTGWEQRGAAAGQEENEVEIAAGLIRCILRCAHREFAADKSKQNVCPGVHSILENIQSLVVAESELPFFGTKGSDNQENPFEQAARIVRTISGDDAPSVPLSRLALLPSRIVDATERPDNILDVLDTLNAIAALINCCTVSFTSDDAETTFMAMAIWLVKVSDQFQSLIRRHNPAALVVVAHWAAYLVQRSANCGCWFLRSSATLILQCVQQKLANNKQVLVLIEDII